MARDWIDYDLAERERIEEADDRLHEQVLAKEAELRAEVLAAFSRGMQAYITATTTMPYTRVGTDEDGEYTYTDYRTIITPRELGDAVGHCLSGDRGQELLDALLCAPEDQLAAARMALRERIAYEHADAHGDVIVMLERGERL